MPGRRRLPARRSASVGLVRERGVTLRRNRFGGDESMDSQVRCTVTDRVAKMLARSNGSFDFLGTAGHGWPD